MAYDDDDDNIDDLNVRRRPSEPVPNYLVQSILVTPCCCMPFGIVAIVNAAKVNSLLAAGDYDGAVQASQEANKWSWIGAVCGLIGGVIYGFAQIAAQGVGGGGGGGFR